MALSPQHKDHKKKNHILTILIMTYLELTAGNDNIQWPYVGCSDGFADLNEHQNHPRILQDFIKGPGQKRAEKKH